MNAFHSSLLAPALGWRLPKLGGLLAVLAVTSALALNPAENPADYIVRHWDAEVGLPHNTIKKIFQSRDGYLWVGTIQGLARFDGLTFTIFNQFNTPAFPGSQVTSLAETDDGSLWIGTSIGLARYKDGRFTTFGKADGLRSDTINAVCVASDDSLWIGGREGITRWVDGKFVNDIDTSAYNTLGLRHIFMDREKSIWIATGSDALRYREGRFTHFGSTAGLPSQPLQAVTEDAAGRVIAVTQNGLYRLAGERFVPFEQNAALASPRVSTALVDRAGNLWIGTVAGLDRYFDGKLANFGERNAVKLGVVDAVFEDREGCLWLGTSGGLYRLTDRRASTLSTKDGISGPLVLAVTQTRDGAFWVSSWGVGVDRIHEGRVTHYAFGAPLSHETVTAIYEAPDGVMWLGNRGSSLDRLEDGKVVTSVYQPGVISSRPVTAIFTDATGELLVGISKRGLLQMRAGQIVPVPGAEEFAAETVWALHRTHDARLLMGTSKGLYERQADRTWRAAELPGVDQLVVARGIIEDSDGTIWLATEGLGLVRWRKDEARAYDAQAGMVDDTLFSVIDDQLGSLWVSSGRGMGRVRKAAFADIDAGTSATLNCMTFGRVDGLLSGSSIGGGQPSAVRLTDGRILTATDQGVAVIDPQALQVNVQPPTIAIEAVVADDRTLTPDGGAIAIPAGTNRVEIRYTALSFIAPHRLRFRYQLEGSDPGWVEAVHERRAYYTHLAPGRYVFRVLACNNDGVWNETGATFALTMLPQFYQTLGFRLAAAGLLAGVIGSGIWLRVRQLIRREETLREMNAVLDRRVRERTAELSRSHEELQQRELLFRVIFEHAPVGISWRRADLGADYHFNSTFRRILDLPGSTLPDNTRLTAMLHPDDAPRQAEMARRLEAGVGDHYTLEQRYVHPNGRVVWGLLAVATVRDPSGRIIQEIGILEDVSERKEAENALRDSNEKFHQLADNLTDAFWIRSPDMSEVHYVSPAFERIWGRTVASLQANPQQWSDFILPADRARVLAAFATLRDDGRKLDIEYRIVRPDGEVRWIRVRGSQITNAAGQRIRHIGIVTDITDWKQAGVALEQAHQDLIEVSRKAGMAEVATGVLHNIGNVLNSVNVSATLVIDQVRESKAANLPKIGLMLQERAADLAEFLSHDPKGRKIPAYLRQLAEDLAAERQTVLQELEHLRKNIEHIKDVVAMQQSHAMVSGVTETVAVEELVEDAVRMNASSLARHGFGLIREFEPGLVITIERHKVLQVLVNLIRNAKHACNDSGRTDKQLTLRTTARADRVRLEVHDNGVGILPENLTRIFAHGFTTRKDGHGFGLHSGALVAKELGGSLTARSDGPGRGATFTLELPFKHPPFSP